jgi:LysR family transcriptional regulator, glycine cleavage system transcriptional activator
MHSKLYDVPPLDPLLAFEAAARNLSFTRAGEELFITQSAVSRQVQQLEAHLGVKLFERRTRALLLTQPGQIFYRAVKASLEILHDSARKLRGTPAANAVVVTTTPGFASLWLIPRLTNFTSRHPGVDVRISAVNEVIDLERAGVDLAIRYVSAGNAFGGRRLFGETVFPVCSPQLAANTAKPLRVPADLAHHVLLNLDDPRAAWLDWQLWFHALGLGDVQPAGTLHFSHYDQLIQSAVAGQGVALGRHPLVRRLLREKKLTAPFKQDVAWSRAYFLIESTTARAKPQVRDFATWLFEETAKEKLDAPPAQAQRL